MKTLVERKKAAVEAAHNLTPPFPRELFLDLTSFCNHSCIFCSNRKLTNRLQMEPDIVHRVLAEAYQNGTRELGLYATGESFMVKNLADYVVEAKKIGYEYLFITTNGSLAVPERVKPVLDAGLDSIKFSINAGNRESYRKIHGKDHFHKVINNLKWVSAYRKSNNMAYRIYVTMVNTDQTQTEVEVLRTLVKPYIDEWDPHTLTNQCGNKNDNNLLGEIEEGNIRGRVKTTLCFQPFKSFTITPEGLISACVLDYQKHLIVADLSRTTLQEAWTNEVYTEFRRRHLESDLKGLICYNCIYNTDVKYAPITPEYCEPFQN